MNKELLYAKKAIFGLIDQFCIPTTLDNDDELYMYDYCESALEQAFNVLGIPEDLIKLQDFCQMYEDNDRAIWNMLRPNDPYMWLTADLRYKYFKEKYERWVRSIDEIADDEE